MSVSPLIGASWDRGVPVGAGNVVDVIGDAGGTFAAGLLIMPLRLSRKTWVAIIMAIRSPYFDGGSTTQSMVCQATIHLLRRQSTLTVAEDRQPVPTQSRLLISPSGTTGAANARAGKVVRANVSPEIGDVTHWKKERRGQGQEQRHASCGTTVYVVDPRAEKKK